MMKLTTQQEQNILKNYRKGKGKSASQIAREMGMNLQRITNCLRRNGIKPIKFWPGAVGSRNARWKGGRRMIKGYLHLLKPNHRLARKDGYVAEHRLLMDEKLIKPFQVVHHKDNNRLNNKIRNLQVFNSNGVHRKLHSKTQKRVKGRFQ